MLYLKKITVKKYMQQSLYVTHKAYIFTIEQFANLCSRPTIINLKSKLKRVELPARTKGPPVNQLPARATLSTLKEEPKIQTLNSITCPISSIQSKFTR